MCIRDSRRTNYVQANYDPGRRRYYQRRNSFSGDRGNVRGGRWRSNSVEGDSRNSDYRPQVHFVPDHEPNHHGGRPTTDDRNQVDTQDRRHEENTSSLNASRQ